MNNNKLEIINIFMEYFWKPAYRTITESEWDKKVASNTKLPLSSFLKANEDTTHKAWLFFTPNWNYGDIADGEKYNVTKTKGQGLHCLFVDLDVTKEWWDIDKSWEQINQTIKDYDIPPSYILKSWWWWHLYWLFQTDLFKELWTTDFDKLQKFLASLFPYGDESNVGQIAKLMRVPLSNHWKHWKKLVELYKYTAKKELEKIETEEQARPIFLYKWEHIKSLLDNIKEDYKAKKINREYADRLPSFVETVKKIKVKDILHKLDYIEYKWNTYKFKLWYQTAPWTYAIDIVDKNGTIKYTDWYRYNEAENYVNNFSLDYHPIDERPRWWTIPFLYFYLRRNWDTVDEFLIKNFWVWIKPKIDVNEQKLEYWKDSVVFWKEWIVMYSYKPDWEIKIDKLADGNWRVIEYTEYPEFKLWWVITDWTLSEDEQLIRYYTLQNLDTDVKINIHYTEDRKSFNRKFWAKWLRLNIKWDPNIVFNVLDSNIDKLKKVETIWKTWYYNEQWIVAIPNEIVYHKKWVKIDDYSIYIDWDNNVSSQKSDYLLEQKQISINEGFEMFKTMYSEHFAVIWFLQFIWLFWFNIWNDLQTIKIYSWLWVFWKSKTWKSTFVEILKWLMWLEFDFKLLDASSWYTKPQGIKKTATDYFPLTIEEFTKAPADIEEIIRWIMNHTKWERWNGSTNIKWEAKAWLIILWEDTPSWDSVLNRMTTISLRPQDRKSTQEKINEIKSYRITNDVYKLFLETKITNKDIIEMLKRIKNKATELKINTDDYSRFAETFVKVFIVWEKLLWLDKDYIIKQAALTQKNILIFKDENETVTIKDFIYGSLQKGYWAISEVEYNNGKLWELSVPKEYGARKRHVLADLKEMWFSITWWTDIIFLNYFVPNSKLEKQQVVFKMIFEEAKIRNRRQYSYSDVPEDYFIL